MITHALSMADFTARDVKDILDAAERATWPRALEGRGVALLFEHPSARTRNAAEMAVFSLGGHPVTIRGDEVGIDRRESAEDVARTLSGYHAVIGARVARHETLSRMARAIDASTRRCPVVNLLSDVEHPTQALADLLTMRQHFGDLGGRTVSFIGDGNNVARSLAIGCALVGAHFRIASPPAFGFSDDDERAIADAGGEIVVTADPTEAAAGADVLYTDVWVSMGEEQGADAKRAAFGAFTIDQSLVERASDDAVVLHCLPAHRGEEISDEVIDGPRSLVWRQAENRMHALRGLLAILAKDVA